MDGPRDDHAKWSKSDRYILYITYVQTKKIVQMNLFIKTNKLTDIGTKLMTIKGEVGEGKIRSMGLTHAYYHIQNKYKDLLCSTGKYIL